MASHFDGVLFRDLFGTDEMRAVFGERGYLDRFLQVEAALARAEAEVGLIPEEAAAEITRKASVDHLEESLLEANVANAGIFTLGIIETWADVLGESAQYVHWGATSHDISDTTVVLQIRDGLEIVERDLQDVRDKLEDLAETYRETPMPGRTQYVHGPPITFGLAAVQWRDEVDRHLDRLEDLRGRCSVVELFGSTGTLAAIEDDGLAVLANFADELALEVPEAPWIASRDRFYELLAVQAGIAGTLESISRNVLFMNRPEVREIELAPADASGSSTNPHKRNPVRPQYNVALARLIRGNANTMNESLSVLGQRDRSSWHVEFAVIPESFLYLGRILANTTSMFDDMDVRPEAMSRNLDRAGAMPVSEAVMIALAEHVGRQQAHEMVLRAVERARDNGITLQESLTIDDGVTTHLSDERIEQLTTPENYLGLAASLGRRTQ